MDDGLTSSAQYAANQAADYAACSMVALAIHEYIITVKDERAILGRRQWGVSTWLFITNRYFMVIVAVLQFAPYRNPVCPRSMKILGVIQLVPYGITAIFSALRLYAVWERNLWMAILVLLLGLTVMIANVVNLIAWTILVEFTYGYGPLCVVMVTKISPTTDLAISSRLAGIVGDIIVVISTWYKTFRTLVNLRKSRLEGVKIKFSLTKVVVRDGSVYFVVLFIGNFTHLMLKLLIKDVTLEIFSPVSMILAVVQLVLVNRFLINLREASPMRQQTETTPPSKFMNQSVRFRVPTMADAIISSMGQTLRDTDSGDEDEETLGEDTDWTDQEGRLLTTLQEVPERDVQEVHRADKV